MWLAVQYPTQSWKIWEIVSAAEPSSCWPPSEPNKANHESIINIYTSIFWEHLHNHHTRSGRVEFLKSRPFLGKRRVKLLQQPDAYIVGLHCCLIYKRKQAAYLCSLMSLVMLYLFFAFSLAFHFFFSCIFPLTQSFLRNRKVTIILTPTFLRSGLLDILVFKNVKQLFCGTLKSCGWNFISQISRTKKSNIIS